MSLNDLLSKREQQKAGATPAPASQPVPQQQSPAAAALFGNAPTRPTSTIAQPPAATQILSAPAMQPASPAILHVEPSGAPLFVPSMPKPAAPMPQIPTASDIAGIQSMDLAIINDVASWPLDATTQTRATDAEQMRALLTNLARLLGSDDVSDALLRTMQFLEQHPDCRAILMSEDIGLCVKALQASHGVILSEKVANSAKRGKRQQQVDEATAALADLGFGAI